MNTKGALAVHGVFLAQENSRFEKGVEAPLFECGEWQISGVTGHESGTNKTQVWETRWLTSEVENATENEFAALTSDGANSKVTLDPGLYYVDASAPAYNVLEHQARLYDATLGETIIEGTSELSYASQTRSFMQGVFELKQSTDVIIQHRTTEVQAASAFGTDAGFYIDNLYTHMNIWQLRSDA
jgi:hypothetical protein